MRVCRGWCTGANRLCHRGRLGSFPQGTWVLPGPHLSAPGGRWATLLLCAAPGLTAAGSTSSEVTGRGRNSCPRAQHVGRHTIASLPRLLPLQVHSRSRARQHSLLVLDGVVAGVAHPDLELEAHDGVAGALAAALPTHRLPALPAVVLQHGRKEGRERNFRLHAPDFPSGWGHGVGKIRPELQLPHLAYPLTQKGDGINTCQGFSKYPWFYWSNATFYPLILSM